MATSNSDKLNTMPSPLASRKEKATPLYGLSYARMMYAYYTKLSPIQNEKLSRIKNNRKYAEGLQSILDVTQRMGIEDTSHLNLDLSPVNYISKIVDITVANLMKRGYRIVVEALDPESKTAHEKDINQVYANMYLRKIDEENNLSGRTGIPLVPKGAKLPENDDEAEIFITLNVKNRLCLAMEKAIKYVLTNNNFDTKIVRKLYRDFVVTKSGSLKPDYDEDYNIKLDYVDVADLVYPYSKRDDFSNIPYGGVMLQMEINEIGQLTDQFSEEELAKIAQTFAGRNNNPAWNNNWGFSYEGYYNNATMIKPYYNFNITVMRFWFISSSKEEVVKATKNGKVYIDSKKEFVDGTNKEKIGTKEKQWRYEGYWIVGSDKIFNYKESDNVLRPRVKGGFSPKTTIPIKINMPDIYDMENKSMVEKAIEAENQLNLMNQKIQQYCIAATPPGWSLNIAALEGVKMAGGRNGLMTPDELYKLGEQTGKFLYFAKDAQGNPLNINPINVLPPSFNSDLSTLINLYNLQIRKINDVMGYNDSMNAQMPSAEMPVGTQQLAVQATINSLQNLQNGFVNLVNDAVNDIVLMIQDSIKYNNKGFIDSIGLSATLTIEEMQAISLANLGITIHLAPEEQKVAQVMNLLNADIQNKVITTSDYLRVESEVEQNPKEAALLLAQLEMKNRKAADASQAAIQNQQGQVQNQAIQAASQAKQQEMQIEIQGKTQLLQVEYQLKGQFSQTEFQQAMELQRLKNIGSNTDSEIAAGGKVDVANATNKGKVVAAQIESNTQIAKTSIVHHTTHSSLDHKHQLEMEALQKQHDHEKEMQENEPTPNAQKVA